MSWSHFVRRAVGSLLRYDLRPLSQRRPSNARSRRKLRMEGLEGRNLMAVTMSISGNELNLTADAAGSQVYVQDLNPMNYQSQPPALLIQTTSPNGSWTGAVPKLGIHKVNFVGSNQADVFQLNTYYRFDGQYYPYGAMIPIVGNLDGRSGNDTITGGIGNDTVVGGSGNDVLTGASGNDQIAGDMGADTIHGNGGNDRLYGDYLSNNFRDEDPTTAWNQLGAADEINGGDGNDLVHGGGGHDAIDGGANNDSLYGGYGDDVIRGRAGNDALYGQFGHDRLYGGGDLDSLFGGNDNDGLYGGYGLNGLDGGGGADRFLVHRSSLSLDVVNFPVSADATIYFDDGVTDYKLMGSNVGWVKAFGKQWSEEEIETVDGAFDALVDLTGNTLLLEEADGQSMQFQRYGTIRNATQNADGSFTDGAINNSLGGWNDPNSPIIAFTDNRMLSGEDEIHRVVFHEIGHNWDEQEESDFADDFRAVAGWRTFAATAIPAGYEQADDTNWSTWWFINRDSNLDGFARNYGKMNPLEDFATAMEAYMLARTGRNYYSETPTAVETRLAGRFDVLDAFFTSLGAQIV